MAQEFQLHKSFTLLECGECGCEFAVSTHQYNEWRTTKATFYCPNGHSRAFKKSQAEILQEQLNTANSQLAKECAEHALTLRKLYDAEKAKKPKRKVAVKKKK